MNFKHSGDWGDIIYALPVIKAMGGGSLYIATSGKTRQRQSRQTVEVIAPLIRMQSYIKECKFHEGEKIDVDLDRFRDYWNKQPHNAVFAKRIADYVCETFHVPISVLNSSWLDYPKISDRGDMIVVNRTTRYQNRFFPWRAIVRENRDKILFIGLKDEYDNFSRQFGRVMFRQPRDFCEAAIQIAVSKIFVGNQSCCYAIAEGLKHNTVQEVFPYDPNCIFNRPNADYICGNRMPNLEPFAQYPCLY